MADKIPVKAIFTGSEVTALGEFVAGDVVPVSAGGTGAVSIAAGYLPAGAGTSPLVASPIFTDGTKVGIGTTTPGAKLDVTGGVDTPVIRVGSPAANGVKLGWNNSSAYGYLSTQGAWALSLGTNGGTSMTLAHGGNVGIGTTTPATGRLLDVAGVIKATGIELTTGAAAGKVLTSDVNGLASWSTAATGMTYKGAWNATTNSPTLADGAGTTGDTYAVTNGTVRDLGSGNQTWVTGGWCIYNGSVWQSIGTSSAVTSVNSKTGAVVLGLASADFANQGTATSVLHGNAAGNPTFGPVVLTSDVSGTLPLDKGGTGQTTAQAAINSLAGAVTAGQYPRGNGTNVVMSAIQAADVPTLNQNTSGTAAGLSATLPVTSGGTGATTLTGLLRGNGAGAITGVAKAVLTTGTDVIGILPVDYGGTGVLSIPAGEFVYGDASSPVKSTPNVKWNATDKNLNIVADAGLTGGNCPLQITATGQRAAAYFQGLGAGGYAAVKLGCATKSSEWLVTAGNNIDGFEIRDSNHSATRLSIDNASGIVDATTGLTVAGTTVSVAGHTHAEGDVTGLTAALAAKKTDSMGTGKLLGRGTTGTGVIEEIILGTGLSLSGTTLNAATSGGTVTGSGTTDYVPKFTGASAIGNSPIRVSGSNVGVGTSPARLFDVGGIGRMALQDMGGQVFNALAYDAPYTTGTTVPTVNATTQIQAAINAASAYGYGTAYVPPGNYLIDGYLNIPAGVTLTGAGAEGKYGARGTVFYLIRDAGAPTGTAAVTVNDDACLTNVAFFYPNQSLNPPTVPVLQYPFAVRMGPVSRVSHLWFENTYQGIDAGYTSWGFGSASSISITWVRGHFLKTGIALDRSADFSEIEHVQFLQYTGSAAVAAYQLANATGLWVGYADSLYVNDITALTYHTGIKLTITASGCAYGTISNASIDQCIVGIDVGATNGPGIVISNPMISMAGTGTYAIVGSTTSGTSSNVAVYGATIWNPYAIPIYWNTIGNLNVNACRFYGWVTPGYAIDCVSGSVMLTNNYLDVYAGGTTGIRLQAGVGRAVVTNNDLGGHSLTNSMGSGYVVANNLP